MIWTLGTFRTQMRPQRAGYFSMNGGRGKTGLSGYFPIATTMISERFNSDTVIPIHSTIFWGIVRFHDTAPLSSGGAGGVCCGKGGGHLRQRLCAPPAGRPHEGTGGPGAALQGRAACLDACGHRTGSRDRKRPPQTAWEPLNVTQYRPPCQRHNQRI